MRVEDLQSKGTGWLIRLHEKGGKQHMMPCHHALAEALHAYIAAAGIAADRKGFLFRTSRGHLGTALSEQPMTQPDAWRMIRRRAAAVGIMAPIGNHSFRATGITAYLSNGGALEHAQEMACHCRPGLSATAPPSGEWKLEKCRPSLYKLNPPHRGPAASRGLRARRAAQ
jgi:integrase